jgi:ATP synthase protein I
VNGEQVEQVEREIAHDMVRRALPAVPVLVLLAGLVWGVDGALSAAYAVGLVLANFIVSAAILSYAARRGPAVLMGAALGGFLVRMGLVLTAVLLVRDQRWVEMAPLAIALLATHVGLLVWETHYVSMSLAFPGLKPARSSSSRGH